MNAVVCLAVVFAAPADPLADWAGTWIGPLKIEPEDKTIPLTFTVNSRDGKCCFAADQVEGGVTVTKNFEWSPMVGKPDWYEHDEKNGLKILGRKVGKSMRFTYQIGTQLVEQKYTKTAAGIAFEIQISDMGNPSVSRAVGGNYSVISHPVVMVQTADLVKK